MTRYVGDKGKFWKIFSEYIRTRDFNTYKTCISCGRPKEYWQLQAGHYCPAGNCGFALIFDELNVNAECGGCNAFDSGHLINYRVNLIKRYGLEKIEALEECYRDSHYRGKITKQWSKLEYIRKIDEYKEKLKKLSTSPLVSKEKKE